MNYIYSEDSKNRLIDILTEELPSLRAKIGITQEDLCSIVGISRQTYSSIETKKRKMSWNIFLSLLFFYSNNGKTSPVIENIGAFPVELRNVFNFSGIERAGIKDADMKANITADVIASLESYGYKVIRPGEYEERKDLVGYDSGREIEKC